MESSFLSANQTPSNRSMGMNNSENITSDDAIWILTSTFVIFTMQSGEMITFLLFRTFHFTFFLCGLTHSLIHSVTHSFTHSLSHSLIPSLIHSLSHSLTHSLTHSFAHSLTHSLIDSLTNFRTCMGQLHYYSSESTNSVAGIEAIAIAMASNTRFHIMVKNIHTK